MANSPIIGKSIIVTGSSLPLPPLILNLTFPKPGGASGIGFAIVRFFAQHSTKIAILDISLTSPSSILSSLKTEFPSTTFIFKKCDISNWDEQAAVFEEVYKEYGRIDVVCANAGVSEITKFLAMEGEEGPQKPNLRTLDINLIGTLYCESHFYFLLFSFYWRLGIGVDGM
jgi:NAD(P)-dependent dehydrogenase (short-subunit alcohol dehydrogenase family)